MIVEYHPRVASDLNDAIAYYNRQQAYLGNEFRAEVFATIERIRLNPLQFPVIDQDIRRGFTHRFPYSVLFRVVNTNTTRILVSWLGNPMANSFLSNRHTGEGRYPDLFEIPGFRVALAVASLSGMTTE